MRTRAFVSLLVAAVVTGLFLKHGLGFMAGFNTTPIPVLTQLQSASAGSRAPLPPDAGRVVLVVIDGLREDEAGGLGLVVPPGMPTHRCALETVLPSFSRPSYVAMSTGVPPWASGVHTNDHEGPAGLPTIWGAARAAGWKTRLVADGTDWWVALFPGDFDAIDLIEKAPFDAFWSGLELAAPGVPGKAFEPGSLTLVHIVDVDDQGHDFGVHDAYRAAAAKAGKKVSKLIAALDPARDTLFLTADHGHIARGGHGGPEAEVLAVPWFAFGAGVEANDARSQGWCGHLEDVPVAIAARLGIGPPAAGFGQTLAGIRPREGEAFGARLVAQTQALEVALGTTSPHAVTLGRARAPSLLWGLAVLVAWVAAMMLVAKVLVQGSGGRAIVSAAILPILGIAIFLIFEPTLSFSAVWLRGPWTIRMGAIFAAVGAVATWVVLQRHAPWEGLLLMACGAGLPMLVAAAYHGSIDAGPVLGDPRAAFAIVASDMLAAASVPVAALGALIAAAREYRRRHQRVWT